MARMIPFPMLPSARVALNVAKALDVSRNTLYRKLHKLHIEVSHPD